MPASLHDFVQAASQVAVALQAAPAGVPQRVWDELHPWVQRLLLNATRRWIPRVTADFPCQVPIYRSREPIGPCVKKAVAICDVCGRSTCLDHCRVDQFGDAICYICIMEAMQRREASGEPTPPRAHPPPWERAEGTDEPQHGGNGAGHHPAPDEAAMRAAYRMLNVRRDASDQELRAALKAKLGRWHPDRFKTTAKKAEAERRFKEIQAAHQVIEEHRKRAA